MRDGEMERGRDSESFSREIFVLTKFNNMAITITTSTTPANVATVSPSQMK